MCHSRDSGGARPRRGKQERKRHMRNGLWIIVMGRVVGTRLAAGLAAAHPPKVVFPGDGVDGPALSYTDNGDSTTMDNNTQLM